MEYKGEIMENEPRAYLAAQWETVILPSIAGGMRPLAAGIFGATLEAYSSADRAYHGEAHIADCLQKLQPYQKRSDYRQLWLALLWHDYVYDTQARDNEARSADWARQSMDWLGLAESDTVHRLILSTASHEPSSEDEALICAIDMSILAAAPWQYQTYAAAVRQEYRHVPEEEYRRERARVLAGFIQPFRHPDFVYLNEQALQNMRSEIEQLTA